MQFHQTDENYLSTQLCPCQNKIRSGKAFNFSIPISLKDGYASICEFPIKHVVQLSTFPLQLIVPRVTTVPAIETRVTVLLYFNLQNGPSHSIQLCLWQVLAYDSHS